MRGNVWEWCEDYWHSDYEGAPSDGSAWLSDNDNQSRLRRGGSWGSHPRYCRSAARSNIDAGIGNVSYGFRVVCSPPRNL